MADQRLEALLINKYLVKEKRERHLNFINSVKTRPKFINELYHPTFFKEDLFELIVGRHEIDTLLKAIGNRTFKDCYVLSTNSEIDGLRLEINTAIDRAISAWEDHGTILVFGDAELIYREHEGPNNRWISKS